MDVVNGKIVVTARAAGQTTATKDGVMADHSSHAWSGVKPSRGFGADVAGSFVHPKGDPQVAGNFSQRNEWASAWAPYWGTSHGDDEMTTSPLHTWDGAAPSGLAPAARWNQQLVSERGRSGAVHDFTADQHRQGWKRSCSSGLCAMDVVNGKIVEPARTMTAESHALGLKPSQARVPDAGSRRAECIHGKSDQLPGSFARPGEMAVSWASSWAGSCFSDGPMPSSHSWGMAAPAHGLAPSPVAPAGWDRLASDKTRGSQPPLQPEADHRDGWIRRNNVTVSSPRWATDQRHYLIDSSPCSKGKLDEEMTIFESQLTRTVSDHFPYLPPSSLTPQTSPHAKDTAPVATTEARSGDAAEKNSTEPVATTPTSTSVLKRRRSELPDTDAQVECGWIEPLKLLVRKGLTVSDVGELGRIIVPKKDAESQAFPQIDTKEGTVLEMEDYTASKRWYFRFKYWINNKSRMYVLENTGEFIKYHSLKEHDIFIVYKDGCKKLVVCGQKKSAEDLDPVLKLSKGSVIESSTSEKQSSPPPPTSIV